MAFGTTVYSESVVRATVSPAGSPRPSTRSSTSRKSALRRLRPDASGRHAAHGGGQPAGHCEPGGRAVESSPQTALGLIVQRAGIAAQGGGGPGATAHFLRRLVERTDARCDQDHVRTLAFNDTAIPDRTAFLTGARPRPPRRPPSRIRRKARCRLWPAHLPGADPSRLPFAPWAATGWCSVAPSYRWPLEVAEGNGKGALHLVEERMGRVAGQCQKIASAGGQQLSVLVHPRRRP